MIFDYIFSGYGLSAMILIERLALDGRLDGKSVLVIDRENEPDKTWCFWEKGPGAFDEILEKQWERALFRSDTDVEILRREYVYKMIKPVALRQFVRKRLEGLDQITFVSAVVKSVRDMGENAKVNTDSGPFTGRKVFNSIVAEWPDSKEFPLLLQHFAGWEVTTKHRSFTPGTAIFMDFTVPQLGNTRFVYVLPLSETRAIVEYTLFSPSALEKREYEAGIANYLQAGGITDYTIQGKESGVIPMTSYPFSKHNTKNMLNIGTAGGWTKPSTGYTLMYALKRAAAVSGFLQSGNPDFSKFKTSNRFAWYDRIFVSVLYCDNASGKQIFSSLFKKCPPELVLRFLREETTVFEDLKILAACPKRLFLKQALRLYFKR